MILSFRLPFLLLHWVSIAKDCSNQAKRVILFTLRFSFFLYFSPFQCFYWTKHWCWFLTFYRCKTSNFYCKLSQFYAFHSIEHWFQLINELIDKHIKLVTLLRLFYLLERHKVLQVCEIQPIKFWFNQDLIWWLHKSVSLNTHHWSFS